MSLSLNPLTPGEIPRYETDEAGYNTFVETLTRASDDLINSLPQVANPTSGGATAAQWRPRKVYKHQGTTTETFTCEKPPSSGETGQFSWHARKSVHPISESDGVTFEAFKRGLYDDHSEHEKEYIDALKLAERVQVVHPGGRADVWNLRYKLPFPTSNRDFLSLVITVDTSAGEGTGGKKQFKVISVPVKDDEKAPANKNGYTRGKYVSVEQVTETPEGIEWLMATASDAGGSIPKSFSEMAMPGKIAEDVPSFIEWLKKRK